VSRFTIDKVAAVLSQLEWKDLLFVVMDLGGVSAADFAKAKGLEARNLVEFEALAAEGAAAAPAAETELEARLAACQEDDTVTVCYTSGTTGNPKGIMLTHLNYWTNCHDGVESFDLPVHFKTLVMLPIDHSFAHTVAIYAAFLCGLRLYFVDVRSGPTSILRNIPINLKEANANFLLTVPALTGNFMKKMQGAIEEKGGLASALFNAGVKAGIKYNGNGFAKPSLGVRLSTFFPRLVANLLVFPKLRAVFGNDIHYCVGGGALLDVKQQEFYQAIGVPVYQGYGLTEAAPVISSNSPVEHKYGTSGRLCASLECRLVKPDGGLAKGGEIGEIVIRGGNVMKGYFKNPQASAEALRDGWLYTGDLAYMDGDGFLVVVGREKALLIAEDGEKYSPEEIEEAVSFSTEVIDQIMAWCEQRKYAIALVSLDCAKVERLVKTAGISKAEELLARLKTEFERYREDPKAKKVQPAWTPAVFQIIEEGFSDKDGTVNSTMKIVRHRIGAVHKDRIEYSYTPEGSKTMNERNLAALRRMFKLD
jgi:long-chain acyl-CoA synthetase